MIWIKHILVGMMAVLMAAIVLTVLGVGALTLVLQRGPLELPRLQSFVQTRLNTQIDTQTVRIGSVALLSGEGSIANNVSLSNVVIADSAGQQLLHVPEVRTSFSLLELVKGQVAPEKISIVGTELSLERALDGSISLFGKNQTAEKRPNVLKLLDSLEAQPGLSSLTQVELVDTRVNFRDRASNRSWVLDNSTLSLTRDGAQISGRAEILMATQAASKGEQAKLVLGGKYEIGSDVSSVSFQFTDAEPAEFADFFRAFDWLRNLDAKLSGSVRASLKADGQLGDLHGVLDLTSGSIRETPESQPIEFSEAKVYFEYAPGTDALNFSQLSVKTSSGDFNAEGFAELQRSEDGAVESMAGQLRLSNIVVQRPDLFDVDVSLKEAAIDARVSFSPLTVEIGRFTVFDGDSTYKISGRSVAGKDHWSNRYDVSVDHLRLDRLKQLWPKSAVHKSRKWVFENMRSGEINDFAGGVSSKDGEYKFAFNFETDNARFRFLKTVPEMQEAKGYGYLTDTDLRLSLVAGYVVAPNNTRVDAAGSSLYIPDIKAKPTPGVITLHAKGGVQAALGLLDVDKFKFMRKAGVSTDIAEGATIVSGVISVPLEKKAKMDEVKLNLRAELLNLRTDKLIKGRVLSAKKMIAKITEKGVQLSGNAALQNIPVSAQWYQSFDKSTSGSSEVNATFDLSNKTLREFGIDLPKGSIKGKTAAKAKITLSKGKPPAFVVTSKLVGARLGIPALSWSKPAKTSGSFLVSGAFSDVPRIDRLEVVASGLKAIGSLELASGARLKHARFSKLKVGKWLDSSAVLTPQGKGSSTIVVSGGTADLRHLGDGSGGSGSNGNSTIKLALDRVRITNDLSLTAFSGKLTTKNGLRGSFVGRVNGSTRVDGQLFPQKHGTALEVVSKDAGGVLASSGLFQNARDGTLRMVLVPRTGRGNYDGILDIKKIRVKEAPALAGLLNAISLVGLLQQLAGEGIHFSTVEGQFKLRKNGVQLQNISAVGPSVGITLDGWYDSARKSVNFEGVATPLYVVNGVFERIFGPLMGRRKGEGLFSFTYRMKGPVNNPKTSVNPLSILTPGAFREVFRRKVPAPATQ